MKGLGLFDTLQGARFARANQGMEAAYVRYFLPEICVRRVEVVGAEQLEGHHVAAPAVSPQRRKFLLARHRSVRHAVGAHFAHHAKQLGNTKSATVNLPRLDAK